jgi:DNA-directed RNA polymerase subunit M/transcription elongation factor TFIIS
MSIDTETLDLSFANINKYFNKKITQEIVNGIVEFTNIYVETNESHFLINEVYSSKVSELVNLFSTSDYLKNMIECKTILPSNLCLLKPYELDPDRYKNIIEKKAFEHNKKNQKGANIFSCKKCHQSNCDVTQKQTRSADEPATTFVTCLECGFSFRF